jgi:acyl carrier protein
MTITINELIPIFRSVFDDDDLIITALSAAQDIDGWDSLAQIRLIISIEKIFGIKFSAIEISGLQNVGDMVQLINSKKNA